MEKKDANYEAMMGHIKVDETRRERLKQDKKNTEMGFERKEEGRKGRGENNKEERGMQCCGSGSETGSGSTCFWASWILLSPSKNSKKNLDSYCFVTSF